MVLLLMMLLLLLMLLLLIVVSIGKVVKVVLLLLLVTPSTAWIRVLLLLLRGRRGSGDGRVQRRVQVEGVWYLAEGEVRGGAGHLMSGEKDMIVVRYWIKPKMKSIIKTDHVRRLTGAAAALRVAGHAKLLQLVLQNVRLLLLVLVA